MAATTTAFDIEALRRAWEAKDVEAILAFYADDVRVEIVDKTTPPQSPRVLTGREAYAELLRDVAGRDLTTRVVHTVAGDGGAAVSFRCRYGDGTEVVSNQVLELRDGLVVRQLEVEAWDE